MHIKEAKKQIRSAIIAYSSKDEFGHPRIPVQAQRPVFLVGAPGIGKTAIVEQIAKELDIGFVSYSMTHHTRQSALGLPFIVEKEYGGVKYSVSEYTMSEILASVYDEMEKTGKKQGILFLDEINCVSETLAPSMLQFLQYKTFGRHKVPENWIVVTAGNPPEYNDSVREFDIAMLDRLKKIEVEPDYGVWKEFAVKEGVHPAILSYLAIKPQYFYRVSMTVDGKSFVTARGWDDLGKMISLYEENELDADKALIGQYIQDEQIASDFANYYELFRKYRSDYQVDSILEKYLPREEGAATTLFSAMNYSVRAGGKRLRPILLLELCRMYGGSETAAEPFVAAIECIHIHTAGDRGHGFCLRVHDADADLALIPDGCQLHTVPLRSIRKKRKIYNI